MVDRRELILAFGPVGLAGWALLLPGILKRSRLLSFIGVLRWQRTPPSPSSAGSSAINEVRSAAPARDGRAAVGS